MARTATARKATNGKKATKEQAAATSPAKDEDKSDELPKHPVEFAGIKPGNLMAFTYWTTVREVRPAVFPATRDDAGVTDVDRKSPFDIHGRELIEAGKSADWFKEEVKLSQTKVIEILLISYNIPFTACFDKDDGEERTLRGRLVKPDPLRGRSLAEDLDIATGHRFRQIDHRTLKWLIVNGVKYVAK